MATETRSRFNNAMAPGLFAWAKENFKRYPQYWKEYYSTRTSKRSYEESSYSSGFGYLQEKPEGTAVQYDARFQGPTKRWTHSTWALACRITEEAIDDDLYGAMKGAMKDLGVSAAATRHLLAARMLMNATATTYHTCGDGKALCVSDHTRLDGSTWSNVASAADPTEASLTAAINNFEGIVDHRGKRYDQKAKTIVCGRNWKFTFQKLLKSSQEPETNNNAINPLKDYNLKLVVDPEITDNRWFLQGEKDEDVGLIWFDRKKPTLSRHGDPDTGDVIFMIKGRWSNECNDPRQIYGVPPFS